MKLVLITAGAGFKGVCFIVGGSETSLEGNLALSLNIIKHIPLDPTLPHIYIYNDICNGYLLQHRVF